MRVEIDEMSGFCFGVVSAIAMAEEALSQGGELWSLGDIVHNRAEVQRLENMGLKVVGHDDLERLAGGRALVRAHGEPPSTFEKAKRVGIEIVDATCPVVAKLQKQVVAAHREMAAVGGEVVILGKRGHAEVVGLIGQVGGEATVIENEEDIDQLDPTKPIYLLSQTTQSLELFERIARRLKERCAGVTVNDTICRRVASREPHLKEFAVRYKVIIFVAGRKSSNGRVLCEVCRSANPRTYSVEGPEELRKEWFEGAESIGICGATSTPQWLMERVKDCITNKL